MSLYKFNKGDTLLNTLVARPSYNFFIYQNDLYLNEHEPMSGAYSSSVTNVPPGYVNLYELNVNRSSSNLIYPFVYPRYDQTFALSSLPTSSQVQQITGSISGSYPLSSSISLFYFASTDATVKHKLLSLKNTINYYRPMSPHFNYSGQIPAGSTYRTRNLDEENINLINIPAIITGNNIKKGSVSLKYYVSGTMVAELTDYKNERGELVQVSGAIAANDGKVAGLVLYNEGFILLTGAWALDTSHQEDYIGDGNDNPKWIYYGSALSETFTGISTPSSSYTFDFQATEKIPNLTMLAHANRGELNYSNNPTFISSSSTLPTITTGSLYYKENPERAIKNIVSSSFTQTTGSFEKITYITKIGIYDEYKNLIAVANLANPVRKREKDSFTFKLKMDL